MKDRLSKIFPQPIPLCGRPLQQILMNVKIVDKQTLADPVDDHTDAVVTVGKLEQLFDVLTVGDHVDVGHAVHEVVSELEGREPGLEVAGWDKPLGLSSFSQPILRSFSKFTLVSEKYIQIWKKQSNINSLVFHYS